MKRLWCVLGVLLAAFAVSHPSAQLLNKNAPIRVGHYHLNVTSVADHRKFWVDTLGGTATKVGGEDAIRFGDVFLILHVQKPTGPTKGTTFDHIGFAVPNVPTVAMRLAASGYQETVGRMTAAGPAGAPAGQANGPGTAGQAGAAAGTSAVYGRFAYFIGPDGVKIELVTASEPTAPPIAHHHVHYLNPKYVEMQQWYMKALNATLRTGQTDFFIGADLPGIGYMLNFFHWELPDPLVGTAGRAMDHVGFEVRNLEAFCKELEAKGIKLTQPYRKQGAIKGVATSQTVDPWGTVVELTEGLDKVVPQ